MLFRCVVSRSFIIRLGCANWVNSRLASLGRNLGNSIGLCCVNKYDNVSFWASIAGLIANVLYGSAHIRPTCNNIALLLCLPSYVTIFDRETHFLCTFHGILCVVLDFMCRSRASEGVIADRAVMEQCRGDCNWT